MIFIVRGVVDYLPPGVRVVKVRLAPNSAQGLTDYFCVADEASPQQLEHQGWHVVKLHDGWYADDDDGGVAVWGNGRYWEVRDTPFDVRERDR